MLGEIRHVILGGPKPSEIGSEDMARVFVSGADGFIGSHFVERAVHSGHQVTALSQYNSFNSHGWLDAISQAGSDFELVVGDIRDSDLLRDLIEGHDAVVHLAALIAIPYSYKAPRSYFESNVLGTVNVLEAARHANVQRVIHTSTSEVYGTAQYVPIDERHPVVGQSPYSASKIGADQAAYSYWASYSLPVVTVRPFNAYGPRQSQRAFIPSVMVQILSGVEELSLGSLTPTRDLTFVEDTAQGLLCAMESDRGLGEVFNMGSGFEIPMADVVDMICDIAGRKIPVREDSSRIRPENSEVERLWSESSRMREVFGWNPEHGSREGLYRGLEKTFAWFKEHHSLPGYDSTRYVV